MAITKAKEELKGEDVLKSEIAKGATGGFAPEGPNPLYGAPQVESAVDSRTVEDDEKRFAAADEFHKTKLEALKEEADPQAQEEVTEQKEVASQKQDVAYAERLKASGREDSSTKGLDAAKEGNVEETSLKPEVVKDLKSDDSSKSRSKK